MRHYSTRPLYSPVPYDFLNVASDVPVLNLKVNSIPSLCQDCSFEYDSSKTVTVNSADLTGNSLAVSLTIPAARRLLQAVTLDDISVQIAEVECGSLVGTPNNFTCLFPTNQDGSLNVPAGSCPV